MSGSVFIVIMSFITYRKTAAHSLARNTAVSTTHGIRISCTASTMRHAGYKTMITVLALSDNPVSQEEYDEIVNSLQIHQLTCSCGRSACMHIHGYYVRYICLPDGKAPLRIMRVMCSECSTTHAILLSSIVPYSQISFQDQCSIVSAYEQGTDRNAICSQNSTIDENNVKAVIRRYVRHWMQRLLSESIPLTPAELLVRSCFAVYSMQFMQIHRTSNRLFPDTT